MVIADGVVTPAMSGSCLSDALLIVFALHLLGGSAHLLS
jgi:hypothetical protein